ncbi:hypothetical protein BKA70DRAFT_1233370 [Coprinopsis sp. MPI-PUGE-AT-0042]|nr:hypothetical protein BKA70DRAFT_1233370 [Coprinopsis sp. MPI-PUGE-AT-0042]
MSRALSHWCTGCYQDFETPKQLKNHQRHCDRYNQGPPWDPAPPSLFGGDADSESSTSSDCNSDAPVVAALRQEHEPVSVNAEPERPRKRARFASPVDVTAMEFDAVPSMHASSSLGSGSQQGDRSRSGSAQRSLAAYDDESPLPERIELIPKDGYTKASVPFRTRPDNFGVYRIYPYGYPSYSPKSLFTIHSLSDSPNIESSHPIFRLKLQPSTPVFPNQSVEDYMKWFYEHMGGGLSKQAAQDLVKNVIQKETFDKSHFDHFRMDKEIKRLDDLENDPTSHFPVQDQWTTTPVSISVPEPGGSASIDEAPRFTAHTLSTIANFSI